MPKGKRGTLFDAGSSTAWVKAITAIGWGGRPLLVLRKQSSRGIRPLGR